MTSTVTQSDYANVYTHTHTHKTHTHPCVDTPAKSEALLKGRNCLKTANDNYKTKNYTHSNTIQYIPYIHQSVWLGNNLTVHYSYTTMV